MSTPSGTNTDRSNNVSDDKEQLYNSVVSGDFETAMRLTDNLHRNGDFQNIKDVVTRLLNVGSPNVIGYAYRIWLNNEQGLVIGCFPPVFKYMFNGDQVKLINNRYGLPMKLQNNKEGNGDRRAWGSEAKTVIERIMWKFIPSLENNTDTYFKIINVKFRQYLNLVVINNKVGDHRAIGSDDDETSRHQWHLRPAMNDGNLLFYIFNRKYDQALKMGNWVNNTHDRVVWGHKGQALGQPAIFGWKIE